MLWDLVGAGASYQVSVCSLQTLLNTKARLLVKLPVHTSSSRRSSCRTAAVVWARSRLEHLGKIACGHRDNNCIAWASLWRIIISFREILGSEWARFLARVFCVFQSSNPKAFFFFLSVEYHRALWMQAFSLKRFHLACAAWPRMTARQRLALDGKTANKTQCLHKSGATDLLSETESRENSWLERARRFRWTRPFPLPSPVGPV